MSHVLSWLFTFLARNVVVVVLPDPFRGMEARRNSTETQQSDHAPRSGSEVENGRSSAEDGAPERLGCGTVKEEVSRILQEGVRRCCMKNSPVFSCISKRTKESCDRSSKFETVHSG